jgi:peptidoglycan/LPS O-acetylase OafA/YrhL
MTIVTLFGQNYLGFPLGIFLREAWVRGWIRSGLYGWVVLLISVLFEMATTFWSFGSPNALALAAAGVVFSVMTWPILQKIFDSPIPQFLGRISFALYLVHLPLVLSLAAWCYLNLNRPLNALFFLGIPALVACACGLAWLVTVLVDEPLVRLLHRLKRHGSRAFSNQGTDLRRS